MAHLNPNTWQRQYWYYGICVVMLGCLFTCRSESYAPEKGMDHDFMPLVVGYYRVYAVEEQLYRLVTPVTTRQYQRKEQIGDAYTDVTGHIAYRLLRFRRDNDSQPWQADSIWAARITGHEAIQTENGLDFVKLVFPLVRGNRWNGNALNQADPDEYELRDNDQPYRLPDETFPQTVSVWQQNDSTLVSQHKRVEIYARSVGMIYKEIVQVTYCTSSPNCVGRATIEHGFRQTYQLRYYGQK